MSQNPIIMAFRKRLRSYGYTNISIIRKLDDHGRVVVGVYTVTAVEPLGHTVVVVDYSRQQMHLAFR